jgi:hypothetical protein
MPIKQEKVLISIVAWLLLIGGTGWVLGALMTFSAESYFRSILMFVVGIIAIKVSTGIRQMRRWALYALTFMCLIDIYYYLKSPEKLSLFMVISIVSLFIQSLAAIYFWMIRKKFGN